MDAQLMAVAQNCLDAAYDGTMAFPDIVGTLIRSGFEGYMVDYRRDTTTYFLPDGDSVALENRPSDETVAAAFDAAGIAAQVRWAQANPPDYSYGSLLHEREGTRLRRLHRLLLRPPRSLLRSYRRHACRVVSRCEVTRK